MNKLVTVSVASAVAALVSGNAFAEAAASNELEEVVVTAERVQSTEQSTPIAMTVYNAEALQENGLVDVGSLAKFDPSLHFSGSTTGYIIIRGITSTDTTESGDPAVPVAYDEFYTNRPLSQFGTLYDLERVEVLRGPQGTLYGRNAVGGIVNIYTAKPKADFDASGSVEIGNYNTQNLNGMLNMPLSSTLWLRAAATSVSHTGYRRIEPANNRGDDADTKSARVQLAFVPNDSFKANLLFQTTAIGGSGPVNASFDYTYYNPDGSTGSPTCVVAGCAPDHVMPPNAMANTDVLQGILGNQLSIRENTIRLRAEYQFANALTLSYLGGYDKLDWLNDVEVSRTDGTKTPRAPLSGPDDFRQHQVPETWNHELRLVSNQSSAFTWQAGAFYFKENSLVYSSRINLPYAYPSGPPTAGDFAWLTFDYPDLRAESKALYGHGNYSFNDQFKLSAGLRYTKDTKFRHGFIHIFGGTSPVPDGHMENHQTTWHVGLDYKPDTDTLLYVKADKGYKAGGYTNTAQYGPENLIAYEAGYKATFARRLQLNLSAFFNDYKDQQVSALGADITAGTQVFNAGKSQIKGLEVGLKAAIGTGTNVGVNATFQNGTYKDFSLTNGSNTCPTNALPNTPPACNLQLAGNQTIQTPRVSASVNLGQTIPLASGSTLTPTVTARYNGKSYFSPFNYPDSVINSYTIVEFTAKFIPNTANWDASVYVRNLTNKIYFTSFNEQQVSGIETYNYSYSSPRTFGAIFNYHFK